MKLAALLALALLGSAPAAAQSDGYTLAQAIAAMRRAHPTLAAARSTIAAAQGDAIDAGLWTNPALSGGWSRAFHNNSYDRIGYLSVGLAQFLELSNAPGARRRAADLELAATRADLAAITAGLELDLELAMIERVFDQRALAVQEVLVSGLHELQRIIHDRVAAGAAPQYDAARIAITVASAEADVADAQADRSEDDGKLRAAIGPGAAELHGDPQYDVFEAPPLPPLAALLARLRAARPDLVALRERARSAVATVSATRRAVFPGVQLQLGAGFGASPGQVDLDVGVALPIPIVDRGQGSIDASLARAAAARSTEFALQTPAELTLAGAYAGALQRRAALAAFHELVAATSEQMLAEARAGYLAARFSVLELADAYSALRDARLRELQLAHDARSADVGVARLIGGSLRGAP